jgi:hypothetical protein
MGNNSIDAITPDLPKANEIKLRNDDDPMGELLPRQRRFLKRFLKTHSRVEAWKHVYRCKSDESALVAVNRFLHAHPEVVDWLYQLAGVTDDAIATVVTDGFKAESMSLDKEGNEHYHKDHYARFKAVELGLRLRGQDKGKGNGNTMNIQIISDAKAGVFKIIEGEE